MTDGGKNTLNRASNSYRILLYCYYAGKNTFTNNFYNSPSKKKNHPLNYCQIIYNM